MALSSGHAFSPAAGGRQYDVYAAPFVPSILRAINDEAPAQVVVTTSEHQLDFLAYTGTFAGTRLVPERQQIPIKYLNPGTLLAAKLLNIRSYLPFFLALWRIEYDAKILENEGFALYKAHLQWIRTTEGEDLYTLSVPGLREDSPNIEMGDTIQLRQLWLDNGGNPVHVPIQNGDQRFHKPIYRAWDGIQLDASVFSVNRAQETVHLKINGLQPGTMVFNVALPLKHNVIHAQWNALAFMHEHLQKSCRDLMIPVATGDEHGVLSDRMANVVLQDGPPLGHIHKSNGITHSSAVNTVLEQQRSNVWISKMLFPTESDGRLQTKLRKVPFRGLFDGKINFEQLHAVNSACKVEYGVIPFLISGPPGTGKTKTLVEIALQLLNTTDVAHILIVAPSEPAADTLALRLRHNLNPKELLRLNRPGRADIEVPKELMPYCYIEQDKFYLPPFPQLMGYNVVVTSTQDAAMLADARLTNSDLFTIQKNFGNVFNPEARLSPPKTLHWGALLMDEAAQATEVDALPALSVICPPSDYPNELEQPRFIMAGDQNQLGPRTASRNVQYSTSLFARLFDRPIYANHPLSRSNVRPATSPPVLTRSMLPILSPPFVNLTRNYRSHPAILTVPSSLFYNDTLIPEVPLPATALQHSPLWCGRRWPVLFVPHTGPDEIERDGGGWYNMTECHEACNLAQHLVATSGVSQKDIVIMSPFAAQVKRLRALIRGSSYGGGSGLWDVNIGPLEAFQGLESRVVIICTTRTRERFLDDDAKRGLGLVGQKRRMNVALTRAKEALFVIGNPAVLGRDEYWREFLAFCKRNGLVRGRVESFEQGFWEGIGKIGVLERALVAKEELGSGEGRSLGAKAAWTGSMGLEDQMWAAGLREVLGDGQEDIEDEYEDDDDYEDESSGAEEKEAGPEIEGEEEENETPETEGKRSTAN